MASPDIDIACAMLGPGDTTVQDRSEKVIAGLPRGSYQLRLISAAWWAGATNGSRCVV